MPAWITEVKSISEPLIAAGTVCVGFLASRIAQQQAVTSGQNLRLALFDRRFSIYTVFRDAMIEACNDQIKQVLDGGTHRLFQKLDEARFLFNSDVFEYLAELRKKIVKCRHEGVTMRSFVTLSSSTSLDYGVAYYESQKWLLENVDHLAKRLQPWLQVDDRLSFNSRWIEEDPASF